MKRGLGKALERLERFYRKEGRALFYFKRSLGKTWSIKSSLNWSNDRKRTRIVGPKQIEGEGKTSIQVCKENNTVENHQAYISHQKRMFVTQGV